MLHFVTDKKERTFELIEIKIHDASFRTES